MAIISYFGDTIFVPVQSLVWMEAKILSKAQKNLELPLKAVAGAVSGLICWTCDRGTDEYNLATKC